MRRSNLHALYPRTQCILKMAQRDFPCLSRDLESVAVVSRANECVAAFFAGRPSGGCSSKCIFKKRRVQENGNLNRVTEIVIMFGDFRDAIFIFVQLEIFAFQENGNLNRATESVIMFGDFLDVLLFLVN